MTSKNEIRIEVSPKSLSQEEVLSRIAMMAYSSMPAIDADIRFAIVPASIARMPSRASSPFLFGASAPMPPIWIPMELRFAKPQSANVAMVNERGSSAAFMRPEHGKCDQFVQHHARAEQSSDHPAIAPGNANHPRNRSEDSTPKIFSRLSGNQATQW